MADKTADQSLRSTGRVNPSTLGMEIDIPLMNYPGRGLSIPVSFSYSSKLWQLKPGAAIPGYGSQCYHLPIPTYAEDSASGWTTSLDRPMLEYTGKDNIFDEKGNLLGDSGCEPPSTGTADNSYVKRVTAYLPGGGSVELRAAEVPEFYPSNSNCLDSDPNTPCTANNPTKQENWNTTYYAIDGSGMRYVENSAASPNPVYRLYISDGSYYDFGGIETKSIKDVKEVRKGISYTDRHGNSNTYHAPTPQNQSQYPNGYWQDTLGRVIPIPMAPDTPDNTNQPYVQEYKIPGFGGGNSVITYKLHWKKLEDALQTGEVLKYAGSKQYRSDVCPTETPTCSSLFYGGTGTPSGGTANTIFPQVQKNGQEQPIKFNPMILAKIELPNGQFYEFKYSSFGEIAQIQYPTGGVEQFIYSKVSPLGRINKIYDDANRGVGSRKLYENTAGTPLEWIYGAGSEDNGYTIRTINPDGTFSRTYLYRGNFSHNYTGGWGTWGYDKILPGRSYEVRNYSSDGYLLSKKLTQWAYSSALVQPGYAFAERQPRVMQEQNFIYDTVGNAVYSTTKFEYHDTSQNSLQNLSTPVQVKSIKEYAFVPSTGNSVSGNSPAPVGSPNPNPTPVPVVNPSTLLRTTETNYLTTDSDTYLPWIQQVYKDRNMIDLVSTTVIKDGAGDTKSKSKINYDDGSLSPEPMGTGNATSVSVWDSTKNADPNNPNAYITTYTKYDDDGNVTETIDGRRQSTKTKYDLTYNAFPIEVTSAIPDPSGTNGSNTAFITTASFDPTTGLLLTSTDANGLESRIEYEPATLRPIRTKKYYNNQQVGSETETVYHDEKGNYWVKSRVKFEANKWAESISYLDGLARAYKSEEINSNGSIFVEKEFDYNGRVKRVTNPFRANETKQWTTSIYDEASRVKEVILPDGAKVITDYGVSASGVIGITKQITDQAGKKRKGISDALGRMIRVVEDPDNTNLATDYVFDSLGNLRKTIQGEQSRYFAYDSLNRLLYAKQPEQETNQAFVFVDPITNNSQWSVKYVSDDNGNIVSTTDARNVSVTEIYDNLNRVKARAYSDATPSVAFFYDGRGLASIPDFSKGKTTRVSSSVSENQYTSFDNLGRLLTHQQITDGQTYKTSYQYNLTSLISETYPSGKTIFYNTDADGKLESVWGQKPNNPAKLYLNQLKYNSTGAIEKMRLGNGRWESAVYNLRGQIAEIGLGYSDTDKSLLKLENSYGTNVQNNGSLRRQKINYRGLPNEISQNYTYDDLNRLKSSTETVAGSGNPVWRQTFNYDRYGNRDFDSDNTTTLNRLVNWKIVNPSINASDNRLKKDQDDDTIADYIYDKAGNLTIDAENQRFVFDAENRMKEFFHSANTSTAPDALYAYDGEGRRVKKKSGNRTVIFVYNSSGSLVAEYDSQPVTNPQISYLTADHLGSPRVITDGRGAVITRHDYMAFGSDITETIGNVGGRTNNHGYNSADSVRKQYTGYERDDESGLEFAQARYYNSQHGRFTSVDPLTSSATIRNPQTFNRYAYVLNSPYKYIDPLGLATTKPGQDTKCQRRDLTCQFSKFTGDNPGLVEIHEDNGDLTDAEIRAQFPVFNEADQAVVNQAIADARNIVDPRGFTNLIPILLTKDFRKNGDTTTPQQAMDAIDATSGNSVERNDKGEITTPFNQNVFDGRTSTHPIDHDNDPKTPKITVAEFFKDTKTVNAITVGIFVFVGKGFFNQDAVGRAKSMIHEGVVHKGFGRRDAEFGTSQREGSLEINSKIDSAYKYYRQPTSRIIDH